jgi:hypothetical protein
MKLIPELWRRKEQCVLMNLMPEVDVKQEQRTKVGFGQKSTTRIA